jgi:hypothetical protein
VVGQQAEAVGQSERLFLASGLIELVAQRERLKVSFFQEYSFFSCLIQYSLVVIA